MRLLALCFGLVMTGVATAEMGKPNFLFIFADDQSYETIAALGNAEVKTPNLDRLVQSGTSFTNAYNMGGWHGAVCVASRTMLNTGRTVWRARAAEPSLEDIARRGETWSLLLKDAGYDTYMTGKWHVSVAPELLFDHVAHERPGMPRDTPEGYNRPRRGEIDPWSPFDQSFGGFWEGGKHWSEVLADDAEAFLQSAAGSSNPFFMYLAFNAPHDPRQSPKRFVDLYPQESVAVPVNFQPLYPYKDAIGCGPDLRDEQLAPFPRDEYAVRVNRQEYYAIITHMDEQIGRILTALEKSGKMENTIIFFSADHGLACGNHGLIGKQNMYEHSMKPPLVIVGPGVPENERREAMVYLQDIMATSLELAGISLPDYVEFNSLMPLVEDATHGGFYPEVYGCYKDDLQRMIRVGDMKLILYPVAGVVRLFNLREDPLEMHDMVGMPAHWDMVRSLFSRLLEKQAQLGDQLDLRAAFPELCSTR